MRFPATRLPTITEAGPTPVSKGKIQLWRWEFKLYTPEHFQTDQNWFKWTEQFSRHWEHRNKQDKELEF